MTVKELIIELLECNLDHQILIADDIQMKDEHGVISGSLYEIDNISEGGNIVCLNFDNRYRRQED